jgi:hypothetical protein
MWRVLLDNPFGFVAFILYMSRLTDYLDTLTCTHGPYVFASDTDEESPVAQSYFVDDSTFMKKNNSRHAADNHWDIAGQLVLRPHFLVHHGVANNYLVAGGR